MRLLHHGLQMLNVLEMGENSLGSVGLWLIEQVVGVVINVTSEGAKKCLLDPFQTFWLVDMTKLQVTVGRDTKLGRLFVI